MTERPRPPAHTSAGYPVTPPPGSVGLAARGVYRGLRSLAALWCTAWFRLSVDGRSRLPVTGAFILAPVHRSNLDFLLAAVAVPRPMRFMAKDSLWRDPRLARLITWLGAVPVKREVVDRAATRWTEAALASGEPVVLFPEGARRTGADIAPLYAGVAWTAARARVPIVPVGIGGADRAMPIGARFIRPSRIRIVIGEPIYPDVPVAGRVARSQVDELTERLRAEMQLLVEQVR